MPMAKSCMAGVHKWAFWSPVSVVVAMCFTSLMHWFDTSVFLSEQIPNDSATF